MIFLWTFLCIQSQGYCASSSEIGQNIISKTHLPVHKTWHKYIQLNNFAHFWVRISFNCSVLIRTISTMISQLRYRRKNIFLMKETNMKDIVFCFSKIYGQWFIVSHFWSTVYCQQFIVNALCYLILNGLNLMYFFL